MSTINELSKNISTKFVDSGNIVDWCSGELFNRRQVSTISENVKIWTKKFVDSCLRLKTYFENTEFGIFGKS